MGSVERLCGAVTEKRALMVLAILFIIMSIAVATVPYDPSTDLADATTNDIWVEYYGDGVHHIPYDEWDYGNTQSVVVEYQGEYVVVNEKGPGHVYMLLPFHAIGADVMFGTAMVFLALLGTYMLGKRVLGWPAGFIASMLVLFNLVVIVMWHRQYWTDASTMHLTVLAFWLLVEGNYRWNGNSLDPREASEAVPRQRYLGIGLCILSGLAFGAAVSTRYPTALLVVVFFLYLLGFYLLRAWPSLRGKDFRKVLKDGLPFVFLLGAFALGLLIVLVPLTGYNSAYFGGPFNSGYDATTLKDFDPITGLEVRNATSTWSSNALSYVSVAAENFVKLLPTFIIRMPAIVFLPLGAYCLRKRKFELAVLLLWIGINFFTYLSLQWVDMYARPNLVPWEPRYWMPSLPPICLLGGFGIFRLAGWLANKKADWSAVEKRAAKVLVTGGITLVLILVTAIPAIGYLQNPDIAGGPHQAQQPIVVTTDLLLSRPFNFDGKPVILEGAFVTSVGPNTINVQSPNSTHGSVTVRFVDWPAGSLPQFSNGQQVWLRGMFNRAPPRPGMPPMFAIGVKAGTQDYIRLTPTS